MIQVTFPDKVRWMVLEFDPQCGTAQNEDTLQLCIPATHRRGAASSSLPPSVAGGKPPWGIPTKEEAEATVELGWWPVLKKFHGISDWPSVGVVLPGMALNRVINQCRVCGFKLVRFGLLILI